MQSKRLILFIFLLFFLSIFTFKEGTCQGTISLSVEKQSLSSVLNQISTTRKVRFAFDSDYISTITVSFTVKDLEVEPFLKMLSAKYPVGYKLIGGTWVLFKVEKAKEIPKPIIPQVEPEHKPQFAEKRAPDFIKPRLYYFSGTARDAFSGEVIKYCEVTIPGGKPALTDAQGYFSSEFIGTGSVRIQAEHLGYLPLDTIISVTNESHLDILLQPVTLLNFYKANEQKVKFQIDFVDHPGFFAFNGDASALVPSLFSGDMKNLIALFPGISELTNNYNGGWLVRCTNPSENITFLDDIPIYEPFFLFGSQSVFNASNLQQSYFSRGGYGADQPGGVAGVSYFSLNAGKNKKPVYRLHANLLDAGLSLSMPLGDKFSFSTAIRKSLTDYWPSFLFRNISQKVQITSFNHSEKETDSYVNGSGASYTDLNLKLSFRPSQTEEISLSLIGNHHSEWREYTWNATESITGHNGYESSQYGANLQWSRQLQKNWFSQFSAHFVNLARNAEEHYSLAGSEMGEGVLKTETDKNYFSEFQVTWKSEYQAKGILHQFGTSYQFFDFSYEFSGESSGIIHKTANHNANLYYQARFNPTPWMRIKAGTKLNYDFSAQDFQFLPRGSIEVYPVKNIKVYYLMGRYLQELIRTTRYDADFRRHPVWYLPDNGTFFTTAFHHIAGLNVEKGGFMANLEAYWKSIDNRPVFFVALPENESESVSYRTIKSSVENRGIDLFLQYRHSIFSHSLAYSLSSGEENIQTINSENSFPSFSDRTHQLKISETASYKGWLMSVNWILATGIPYLTFNTSAGNFVIERTPGFSRFDLSFLKHIPLKRGILETGVTLLNIFDRKNIVDVEYLNLKGASTGWITKSTFFDLSFSPQFYIALRIE